MYMNKEEKEFEKKLGSLFDDFSKLSYLNHRRGKRLSKIENYVEEHCTEMDDNVYADLIRLLSGKEDEDNEIW